MHAHTHKNTHIHIHTHTQTHTHTHTHTYTCRHTLMVRLLSIILLSGENEMDLIEKFWKLSVSVTMRHDRKESVKKRKKVDFSIHAVHCSVMKFCTCNPDL